jgi:hypothetical protein
MTPSTTTTLAANTRLRQPELRGTSTTLQANLSTGGPTTTAASS